MTSASSNPDLDSLLPAASPPPATHFASRQIAWLVAFTAGVLGVGLVILAYVPTTGARALRHLDGGCGITCGKHSEEVKDPKDWVELLKRDRSWNNVSLLEAYLHASFDLSYNCRDPLRLPGPVIPGTIADGGYVVCEEPDLTFHKNNCTLLSFGIASDDTFEASIAKRYGCEVHEFDPTVNESLGALNALNDSLPIYFHKLGCWSHKTNLSIGPVDSIENLVRQYSDDGKQLSLKIDVEGAEWETLPAVPDWLFDQVDHLILEIHTTVAPDSPLAPHPFDYLMQFEPPTLKMVESLARIREKFYLFHWHVNNCCYPTPLGTDYGVPVWNASGYTDAELAVAAPGSVPVGHNLVVPATPGETGMHRGKTPNLPDGASAPPGLAIPGPIELSFVRKSLVQGTPKGPFNLHEEMNGPNSLISSLTGGEIQLTSNEFPNYGWTSSFDENWQRYKLHASNRTGKPARNDSLPARNDSLPARNDSLPARNDSLPARNDSLQGQSGSSPTGGIVQEISSFLER